MTTIQKTEIEIANTVYKMKIRGRLTNRKYEIDGKTYKSKQEIWEDLDNRPSRIKATQEDLKKVVDEKTVSHLVERIEKEVRGKGSRTRLERPGSGYKVIAIGPEVDYRWWMATFVADDNTIYRTQEHDFNTEEKIEIADDLYISPKLKKLGGENE